MIDCFDMVISTDINNIDRGRSVERMTWVDDAIAASQQDNMAMDTSHGRWLLQP